MDNNQGPVASGQEPDATGRDAREPDNRAEETAQEQSSRDAEERLIDDLISRGEAVPEGTEPPPGATHEIYRDDQGRRHVRRIRFSAS